MPYMQLFPLDDQALETHRPPHETKWSRLENVIVRDGVIANRPGFVMINWDGNDPDMPSVERGVPVAIAEVFNPGSSNTGRQDYKYITETLRPDGSSDIVAGWTGDHTAVDEVVPDSGSTKMYSATEGAQKNLTWGNIAGTIDTPTGILVRARARVDSPGVISTLRLFQRSGTTNYLVGDRAIYVCNRDGGEPYLDDWQTVMWNMPYDYATSSTNGYYTDWTNAKINALNLVVESESIGASTVSLKERLVPNADGTDTGWFQWQDYQAGTDTTATYTDYDSTPDEARWMFIDTVYSETFVRNSMYTVTDDARQSWTTADITKTYNSITSLDFSVDFILKGLPTTVTLYYYPAGVKANAVSMGTITTDFERDGTGGDIYYGTLSVTENPDTEAAWSAAQINAGEWAIEYNEGTGGAGTFCVVRSITMYVRGEVASGSNLELDTIAVDVYGADAYSDYASGVLGRSRVWTTTKAHLQMVDDFSNSISDITNSVAVTSPPNLPLDHAQLYGQLYVVNGEDATRIYPVDGDDDFGALTTNNADGATAITGRTVWSFGGRIFYGYVNDNTTYTPERVAYSKLNDGTTHNHASAGDIDLIDTPGGVVKGLPLSEDLCAVYKEVGIYTLRRTGNDTIPFIRDVVDFQTSNVATMTTKRVSATNGNPVHIFLGWSPADGYSVFMFDGGTVNNIGLGISKKLREDFNHRSFRTAFAEVDPLTRHYYLFLPDENETLCTRGFSYNIRREQWREFTLPFYATCAGIWTLGGQSKALNGTQTMIIGGGEGYLRKSDWRLGFDSIVNGNFNEQDSSASSPNFNLYNISDAGLSGTAKEWYTSYLETGDLILASRDNPEVQSTLHTIHMTYYTMGSSKVIAQVSTDGGQNWTTAQTHYIGDNSYTRRLRYIKIDIPPEESVLGATATATGRRHRVRLQFDADTRWDSDYEQDLPNNAFEIAEIWVGFETGGDDA